MLSLIVLIEIVIEMVKLLGESANGCLFFDVALRYAGNSSTWHSHNDSWDMLVPPPRHLECRSSSGREWSDRSDETVTSIINEDMTNVIDLARFPFDMESLLLPS